MKQAKVFSGYVGKMINRLNIYNAPQLMHFTCEVDTEVVSTVKSHCQCHCQCHCSTAGIPATDEYNASSSLWLNMKQNPMSVCTAVKLR